MPNIRTRFVAEGEKEYRQALKDINSGLGILNAESKKLQEQFKGNEDSLEALTATNENLDQIVLSLSDKLDLQKKRLAELSQAYGESDDRTQRMRKAVVETETALLKQQHALDENTKALDDFGEGEDDAADKAQGLGDALNDIGSKFGISLPKEMTNTLNGMLNLDAQTLVLAGGFAAVAAAVVEAEKALISLTIESAAYADEILTQSVVTGLSAEALQEYQYAAELVDVSLDTLTSSQAKMIRSMDAARRGSKEQAEAFDKLGISVQNADGTLRDAQDVFGDAIDALGAISNETERDAIAMTIFGRSARDLNPLIKAGSDGLRELTQEAHNVGYVMGEEALDALGAVDDQLQRMNRSGEALKNQIAVGMAPAVENLMKKGTDLFVRLQEAAEGSGILEVFGALLDVVSALEPLFDVLFGTAEDGVPVLQTLALALGVLADALTIVANTIAIVIELFKQLFNLISGKGFDDSNLTRYGENIAKVFSNEGASARAWSVGFGKNIGRNADGTDYWPGGLTWVGERGPELVSLPQGSRVYSAEDSRNMGGTNNYYLTVQSRDMETVAAMTATFKRARQAERAK
mgnify:FL=1|jgi:hypothetical protein